MGKCTYDILHHLLFFSTLIGRRAMAESPLIILLLYGCHNLFYIETELFSNYSFLESRYILLLPHLTQNIQTILFFSSHFILSLGVLLGKLLFSG